MRVRLAATGAAVASIWIATAAISIFAPDLVHGSDQQHLPVAALVTWFWAGIATAFVLIPLAVRGRDRQTRDAWWYLLAAAAIVAWTAAALVGIFTPRMETGTDPTRIPVGAIVAPVIATAATAFAASFTAILARPD